MSIPKNGFVPGNLHWLSRSYLKKIFWLNFFVGRSVQILEILEYSSASILNQNLFFEIASSQVVTVKSQYYLIFVIPAKAGIHQFQVVMDSRFRGSDGCFDFLRVHQH